MKRLIFIVFFGSFFLHGDGKLHLSEVYIYGQIALCLYALYFLLRLRQEPHRYRFHIDLKGKFKRNYEFGWGDFGRSANDGRIKIYDNSFGGRFFKYKSEVWVRAEDFHSENKLLLHFVILFYKYILDGI